MTGDGLALAGLILGYLGGFAVPVVLIIAAVAIPNLIGAKITANQLSAIQSLRAINQAETLYSSTYQTYTTTMTQLGPSADGQPTVSTAGIITDAALIDGNKAGYVFKYSPTGAAVSSGAGGNGGNAAVLGYTINADPLVPGKTGSAHYFLDESGTIHVNSGVPAGPSDPKLGE